MTTNIIWVNLSLSGSLPEMFWIRTNVFLQIQYQHIGRENWHNKPSFTALFAQQTSILKPICSWNKHYAGIVYGHQIKHKTILQFRHFKYDLFFSEVRNSLSHVDITKRIRERESIDTNALSLNFIRYREKERERRQRDRATEGERESDRERQVTCEMRWYQTADLASMKSWPKTRRPWTVSMQAVAMLGSWNKCWNIYQLLRGKKLHIFF